MAGMVFGEDPWSPGYHGLPAIFAYTNADGELRRTNCGQAAVATFLTHHGVLSANAEKAITTAPAAALRAGRLVTARG